MGVLDHLGIGAAIDSLLLKSWHHDRPFRYNQSHDPQLFTLFETVAIFIGNTMEKSPASKLIRVIPCYELNDDVLGATLYGIYHYGPTKLFNEVILEIMKQGYLGKELIQATLPTSVFRKNTKTMATTKPEGRSRLRLVTPKMVKWT